MGQILGLILTVGLICLTIYLGYGLYKEIARLRRKKRIEKELSKNKNKE